jgi:hypothetical protein
MATRKVYGGMIHPSGNGGPGGGNKDPNGANFKPGPHNAMNKKRGASKKGASKKRVSAKNYRNENVVRRKTRVNLKNVQAKWNANQMLSNMERLGIKKKEKKKGIKFENEPKNE